MERADPPNSIFLLEYSDTEFAMRRLGRAVGVQIVHAGAALRLAAAECVDPFPLFPLGSRLRRRGPGCGFVRSRFSRLPPRAVRAAVFLDFFTG